MASRKSTKIPKDASNNNNNTGTIELGHGIVESMGANEENNPNNNNNNNNKNDQATRGENKSTDRLVNILIKIKNFSDFDIYMIMFLYNIVREFRSFLATKLYLQW